MTQARDRLPQLLGPYLRGQLPHGANGTLRNAFEPQQIADIDRLAPDHRRSLLLGKHRQLGRTPDRLHHGRIGGYLADLRPVLRFQLPDPARPRVIGRRSDASQLGTEASQYLAACGTERRSWRDRKCGLGAWFSYPYRSACHQQIP